MEQYKQLCLQKDVEVSPGANMNWTLQLTIIGFGLVIMQFSAIGHMLNLNSFNIADWTVAEGY